MREIKFRAWDESTKMMVDWDYLKTKEFVVLPNREVDVLLQFTGLKDKNSVDIYEGDILRPIEGARLWSDQINRLHVVEDIRHPFANCGQFEVIGNIYENPELLEQQS